MKEKAVLIAEFQKLNGWLAEIAATLDSIYVVLDEMREQDVRVFKKNTDGGRIP